MPHSIVIKASGVDFEAELNDGVTGKAIYGALPIRAKAQRWGGEIYFSIPVSCELEEDSREVLEEGADFNFLPSKSVDFVAGSV